MINLKKKFFSHTKTLLSYTYYILSFKRYVFFLNNNNKDDVKIY